jgi:hypothetical protein
MLADDVDPDVWEIAAAREAAEHGDLWMRCVLDSCSTSGCRTASFTIDQSGDGGGANWLIPVSAIALI